MRNGHYALIHLHRQRIGTEIGTKIGRYGGTEIERYRDGEKQYIPMPICLGCLEFVACRFTLVRFTLVRVGSLRLSD